MNGQQRKTIATTLFIAAAFACAEPPGPPAQGVVLVVVDTLRADHLGSYDYARDTSPTLDRFAQQGVLFRDVTVQWPKTWASMASLMTGRFPRTTGLRLEPRVLPESLLMLSEVFADAGYETAAIVANFNVGRSTGFQQGFDHFVESWEEKWREEAAHESFKNAPGRVKQYTNATLVTDQALAWLERRDRTRPFFLWLHYMDPHGPYLPPDAYARFFTDARSHDRVASEKLPAYQQQRVDGRLIDDLEHYRAQYDRLIRYFDSEFGRLLAGLETLGHGQSLVALTADHGESLGEHGYYLEHGFNAYQPTARVPLVVAMPGVVQAGRRIESPVALIDLSPTLVDLAGIEIPTSFEGRSHADVLTGRTAKITGGPIFMEAGYDVDASQRSVRDGKWKLIHVRSEAERRLLTGSEYELYDLRADPDERANVARWHPDVVARMKASLAAWHANDATRDELGVKVDPDTLAPRDRDMLKALGYIDP